MENTTLPTVINNKMTPINYTETEVQREMDKKMNVKRRQNCQFVVQEPYYPLKGYYAQLGITLIMTIRFMVSFNIQGLLPSCTHATIVQYCFLNSLIIQVFLNSIN